MLRQGRAFDCVPCSQYVTMMVLTMLMFILKSAYVSVPLSLNHARSTPHLPFERDTLRIGAPNAELLLIP